MILELTGKSVRAEKAMEDAKARKKAEPKKEG